MAVVALALLLAAAGALWFVRAQWDRPLQKEPAPRAVEIPPGSSLRRISLLLAREGVIARPFLFRLLTRVEGQDRVLKAGEYELGPHLSPRQVLRKLARGEVIQHPVTIPEGSSLFEVARLVEGRHLLPPGRLLPLAMDPAVAKSLGVEASSLEGYLFPETYFFPKGMSARKVLRTMVEATRKVLTPEIRRRAEALGLGVHGALTLASIIEKETDLAEERPLVSAVFHNRLQRGMPLQGDPTVIYALKLAGRYRGKLGRGELAFDSPYNTYRHKGLPPGPIANSGLDSLRAALYPAPVPYLYFVAKEGGGHHFSRTIEEHRRAIARERRRASRTRERGG
ncbi:MAG: endolytic transglycosylase MltG [Nitrospinota bacterium]